MSYNQIKYFILIILLLVLSSCQKKEILEEIIFDNKLLGKIHIASEIIEINNLHNINFAEPYIDHVMKISPAIRINAWLEENIITFGFANKLVININKAAITQKELENTDNNNIIKNKEYIYEINLILNYILYDNNSSIIATTNVETKRSTTSIGYISLRERNITLDNLTLEAIRDLSNKSVELIKMHMMEYVL